LRISFFENILEKSTFNFFILGQQKPEIGVKNGRNYML